MAEQAIALADHDAIDYAQLVADCRLVVDTRNATRPHRAGRDNVVAVLGYLGSGDSTAGLLPPKTLPSMSNWKVNTPPVSVTVAVTAPMLANVVLVHVPVHVPV